MSRKQPIDKKALIESILYNRCESGDSCVETAEAYLADMTKEFDPKLYSALKRLNDAAEDMVSRLTELNDEYDLGYEDI